MDAEGAFPRGQEEAISVLSRGKHPMLVSQACHAHLDMERVLLVPLHSPCGSLGKKDMLSSGIIFTSSFH